MLKKRQLEDSTVWQLLTCSRSHSWTLAEAALRPLAGPISGYGVEKAGVITSDQPTRTPSFPCCLSWPLRKTVIFKGDDVLFAFYFLAKITLFFFFWPHRVGMWNLVSQPGIEPAPLQWKCRVLITGCPGKPHIVLRYRSLAFM